MSALHRQAERLAAAYDDITVAQCLAVAETLFELAWYGRVRTQKAATHAEVLAAYRQLPEEIRADTSALECMADLLADLREHHGLVEDLTPTDFAAKVGPVVSAVRVAFMPLGITTAQ